MSSDKRERKSKHYSKEKEDDYYKRNRYEEGPRYYDYDKYKVEEELQEERDYLVGSRYYPESRGGRNERRIRSRKELSKGIDESDKKVQPVAPKRKAEDITITSRTGGAYIPPAKLRLMQASITDKSSAEYQRIAWEALKKSIHGHINKVNTSNIGVVARLLFKENIVRGRGLLCRSIIQAQSASVTFTNVYACLVAIINSKFPNVGELLLKRVIVRFKRAYKRNDKAVCISAATFIAHLINQKVAHEIVGLELVTLLVENPTDDSIEVAVAFLKEAGQKLSEVTSKGTNAIFDMLRNILHQGQLEKRVQYMIEVMFQVRKDDFATFPAVPEELDLVDEDDQFTHLIGLDDQIDVEDMLNVFKMDGEFEANEARYKELRGEILETDSEGSGSDSGDEEGEGDTSDEDDEDNQREGEDQTTTIVDRTETNLMALRKTIYLTIQSSLDFEECAHKLLKMEIKPGQEKELCHMFLDCCAEQRTYEKFFGLLSQRFCQVNKLYIAPFEDIFGETYSTVHRLDTNRLRNVAKLFAHLLFTDAISWAVLSNIRLNEEDTTSSSRIFIKILFQELSEYMGLTNLNARLKDPALQSAMEGLFPRDNPKNTRFAINFFTSIGLGGLTDELREHLKNIPKPVPVSQLIEHLSSSSSADSSSSSSDSEDESSSSSSSSSDSEEEETKNKAKKKVTAGKSGKKKQGLDKKDNDKSKKGKKETGKTDRSKNEERDSDKKKDDKRKTDKTKNDERDNEKTKKDKREVVKNKHDEREYHQNKNDEREYRQNRNDEREYHQNKNDEREHHQNRNDERSYKTKNREREYHQNKSDERDYHKTKIDEKNYHKHENVGKEHYKTKGDRRESDKRGKCDREKHKIDGKEKINERERNYHEDSGSMTIRKERKDDITENLEEPDWNREKRREHHHHKEKERIEEGVDEERRRRKSREEDMVRHDREESHVGKQQCRNRARREASDRKRDLT